MTFSQSLTDILNRLVSTLERIAPPPLADTDFEASSAFIWQTDPLCFVPVKKISRVPLKLLRGIDPQRAQLLTNTRRFAKGLPANNVLLWGARGMGKSSLIKAVHGEISEDETPEDAALKLIEIHREDIASLPKCLSQLASNPHRFIVFCDDLSFDADDTSYKSLKAMLEGGIEGRPENVLFYATSNRRHLLSREMMENELGTAINPSDAVHEKTSLSDRFGLWIGFHNCSQEDYLAMVESYAEYFDLPVSKERLSLEALAWSRARGARSGRVAWQFIQELAGQLERPLI